MKTFYFTIVLFFLTLAAITVNFIYINNVSNRMIGMAAGAPSLGEEGCLEAIEELDKYWEKNHNIVRLSVSFTELNLISNALVSMKTFAEQENSSEYENARELLINAIHEMRRLESFNISSIL